MGIEMKAENGRLVHVRPLGRVDEMTDAMLAGIDVLPEAQLKQLVATGRLVSVTTFTDHMRPDVHWIEPEEYGKSFDELIKESNDMAGREAAFTESTPEREYPGYINATLGLDEMVITVRSPAKAIVMGDNDSGGPGNTAQLRMPLAAWDDFILQSQRVRAGTAE